MTIENCSHSLEGNRGEQRGGRRENIPVSSGAVPSFPCLTTTHFAQSGEV